MSRHRTRSKRGTFVLIFAVLFGLVVVCLFALQFMRIVGTDQEQRTAIDAAALAAANDLSRIVINDSHFGYISLSDYAPSGNATKAGDNFDLPVQSINTILATNRLDCIIADWWHNPTMQQYAERDYKNAVAAADELISALNQAIQPGGSGTDINGIVVTPYDDAIAAYKQNAMRMAGGKSDLVKDSMHLSLGYELGLNTNIQIPQPDGIAKVAPDAQEGRNYKAFVDVPYNSKHYVFAATNNSTTLVDFNKFQLSVPNLPYEIPTIIRCDADQLYQPAGTTPLVKHATACAQPACLVDSCPHPGILSIDFPDGSVPELQKPADFLENTQIIQSPCDLLQTSTSGDSPPGQPVETSLYAVPGEHHPFVKDVVAVAVYDWIRRGRWRVDVDSLTKTFNNNFSSQSQSPQSNQYEVASDGSISYVVRALPTNTINSISQNQYFALSGLAVESSNNNVYDVLLYDFCYQPGTKLGGMHAGEPLNFAGPAQPPITAAVLNRIVQSTQARRVFPTGPVAGGPRSTYSETGIATSIIVTRLPSTIKH